MFDESLQLDENFLEILKNKESDIPESFKKENPELMKFVAVFKNVTARAAIVDYFEMYYSGVISFHLGTGEIKTLQNILNRGVILAKSEGKNKIERAESFWEFDNKWIEEHEPLGQATTLEELDCKQGLWSIKNLCDGNFEYHKFKEYCDGLIKLENNYNDAEHIEAVRKFTGFILDKAKDELTKIIEHKEKVSKDEIQEIGGNQEAVAENAHGGNDNSSQISSVNVSWYGNYKDYTYLSKKNAQIPGSDAKNPSLCSRFTESIKKCLGL